jgi:hypothetical protein
MLDQLALRFNLLAQRTRWEHMGDRFSGEHARLSGGEAMLIVGGGVLFILAIVLLHRAALDSHGRFAFASNSSRRLFGELCRAHQLGYARRRLLKRLAAARGLSNSALLFVEPQWFDTTNLPVDLTERADELERIRDDLFGPKSAA